MGASQDARRENLLVLRAQAGDREALDDVLGSVQAPLYRYLCGLVGDAALAEDALQDVLVSICRHLGRLREPAVFRSWAYRIASRRAWKLLRREQRRAGLPLDDPDIASRLGAELSLDPPEPPLYDQVSSSELRRLLAAISPASRAVLGLHYLGEMSLREIADILELPVGTVKSRLAYGLASIRRLATVARTKEMTRSKEVSNG